MIPLLWGLTEPCCDCAWVWDVLPVLGRTAQCLLWHGHGSKRNAVFFFFPTASDGEGFFV